MTDWNDLRGGLSECGREIEDSRSECLALLALNTGEGGGNGTQREAAAGFYFVPIETPAAQIYEGLVIERLISAVEKAEEHADEQPETLTEEELWGDGDTAHEQSQSQFGDGGRYL